MRGILLLGTNLGDKVQNLDLAIAAINGFAEIHGMSGIYQSDAWGFDSKSDFFNQAIEVSFKEKPSDFMLKLLDVEKKLGRVRTTSGYSDRVMDIDILCIDEYTENSRVLICPHPRLELRLFALLPLQELRPNWQHKRLQKSVSDLIKDCPDKTRTELILYK